MPDRQDLPAANDHNGPYEATGTVNAITPRAEHYPHHAMLKPTKKG